MSIAYATLDYILQNIKCRTMFATHYHELARMLGVQGAPGPGKAIAPLKGEVTRPGVAFWCTDVDEMDGLFAYSYRLKPGINYNSHAIVSGCSENALISRRRPNWPACQIPSSRLLLRPFNSSTTPTLHSYTQYHSYFAQLICIASLASLYA